MVNLVQGKMKRPQMTFKGKCFDGQSCDRELTGCDDESQSYWCRHGQWDDPKENAPCEPKKYYSDPFDRDDEDRKKRSCKPKPKRKIVKKSKRK